MSKGVELNGFSETLLEKLKDSGVFDNGEMSQDQITATIIQDALSGLYHKIYSMQVRPEYKEA